MSSNIAFCGQCGAPRRAGDVACPYCGIMFEIVIPIMLTSDSAPVTVEICDSPFSSDQAEAPVPPAPARKKRSSKPAAAPAAAPPPAPESPAADALTAFLAPAGSLTGESERVVSVLPYVNHPDQKGFLGMGEDFGCLVLTTRRLMFVTASDAVSKHMQKEIDRMMQALEKQKSKNWRSLVLGWDFGKASWHAYYSQPPERLLGKDSRNLSKNLDQIRYITVTLDEDDVDPNDSMEVVTNTGKAEFSLDNGVGHIAVLLLKRVLGDRLIVK